MSYYGALNKDYILRFGEWVDVIDLTLSDYVREFPNGTAQCTWAVEQPQIVPHGVVQRVGLDGKTRMIGRMSDTWTFALWNDAMYSWLLNQADHEYDVLCTMATYDRSTPAHMQPFFWGYVHLPTPNELKPLGNRYFERPQLQFYELRYIS